ncbi:hypothetical protein, partial [Sutterella wadsworthensis]|uniref:hypothetical protein n=1 Tax=Sutterella wadsworthensis TaxID=40545 RepID=UPI001E2F3B66
QVWHTASQIQRAASLGCPWNNLPRHRNPDTPVKVKKMTVTNNIADDSQYGIWAQNTDKSGVNLSVDAETVEITAINHAVSLHSGAVAEFKNIKSLTATADRNAFRAVGGSSIT